MVDPRTASFLSRLFRPVAEVRPGEAITAMLMFAYSFLAMTAYNVIKPITRSEFIASLGADNLPWIQFAAGVLIGVIMQGYTRLIARVPRRWIVPVTQAGLVALLLVFWALFTQVGAEWVAVLFYLLGLIMGILLISQFWTIANDIYDARQAKRLFGPIGGGASLGGAMGAGITGGLVRTLGSHTMLLVSAAILCASALLVTGILRREKEAGKSGVTATSEEQGVGGNEALRLLRQSRHLQIIAFVIGFAAVGAAIIEQQLNMAAEEAGGSKDAVAALLAQVIVYLSLIGFVIQVLVTSRVHRVFGIGFALLILPVSLGATGLLMLTFGAFWTAALARVLDTSLRYTIDKTSREVLFLPLPLDVKYRAKPFVDVSVDRFAKGLGALLILVLIKDWGLGLDWRQLSYASLTMMVLWILLALRARREYLSSFRERVLEGFRKYAEPEPAGRAEDVPADPGTVQRLVAQLSDADEQVQSDAIAALRQLRVQQVEVAIEPAELERLIHAEAMRALAALADYHRLATSIAFDAEGVIGRALGERRKRAIDRIFGLLALGHPPQDVAALRAAVQADDARSRSSALEYVDNLLPRGLRRRVLVLLEDLSDEERARKATALAGSSARGAPEVLAELARDHDPDVAATARALSSREAHHSS